MHLFGINQKKKLEHFKWLFIGNHNITNDRIY